MKSVAIIGATGVVGRELLTLMEERSFPCKTLRLFASAKSVGTTLLFRNEPIPIEPLEDLSHIDIAFFCAGSKISKEWRYRFGGIGIDLSSAFRMDPTVPLVIPEINPEAIAPPWIASPNCVATLLLLPLAPLHQAFEAKRAIVSTYQAASGGGAFLLNLLKEETLHTLENHPFTPQLPFPYAFNLYPHNSPLTPSGYVEEEIKIREESQKILSAPTLSISATAIRVPTFRSHALSANISFHKKFTINDIKQILSQAKGVRIFENPLENRFPTPLDATHQNEVLCGRFRIDPSHPHTLEFWATCDQLRKGAALNALQIGEMLYQC